jgi:hypothetical protein
MGGSRGVCRPCADGMTSKPGAGNMTDCYCKPGYGGDLCKGMEGHTAKALGDEQAPCADIDRLDQ